MMMMMMSRVRACSMSPTPCTAAQARRVWARIGAAHLVRDLAELEVLSDGAYLLLETIVRP